MSFFCGYVENILPPTSLFYCNSDMTAVTVALLNCKKGNDPAAKLPYCSATFFALVSSFAAIWMSARLVQAHQTNDWAKNTVVMI